jgi:hypothetical protein
MTDRLPVVVAQDIAASYGQQQVIVVTWDGQQTHVVTYGVSLQDCDQAAQGGDLVKAALGWPESLPALPPRVQELQSKLQDLLVAAQRVVDDWDEDADNYTPAVERLRDSIKRAQPHNPKDPT